MGLSLVRIWHWTHRWAIGSELAQGLLGHPLLVRRHPLDRPLRLLTSLQAEDIAAKENR